MKNVIVPSENNLICITKESQEHEWDDIFQDIDDPFAEEVSRDNEGFKADLKNSRRRDRGRKVDNNKPSADWTEQERSERLAEALNSKTEDKRWPPMGMDLGDLWGRGEFSINLDLEDVSMLRNDYNKGTEIGGVASQNPVISIRITDKSGNLEGAKVGVSPEYAKTFDDPGKFLSQSTTIVNGFGTILFTYSYDTETRPVFIPVGA